MGRPGLPNQLRRQFWQRVRSGLTVPEAAAAAGVAKRTALDWHKQAGGVNPYPAQPVSGRYLSFEEREDIAVGIAAGHSQAEIARGLGRYPSTVSREITRNSVSARSYQSRSGHRYRAGFAQSMADKNVPTPQDVQGARQPATAHGGPASPDQALEPGADLLPAAGGLP